MTYTERTLVMFGLAEPKPGLSLSKKGQPSFRPWRLQRHNERHVCMLDWCIHADLGQACDWPSFVHILTVVFTWAASKPNLIN